MSREARSGVGVYDVVERQEKTTFDQLMDLYKCEGDRRITSFNSSRPTGISFGGRKLGHDHPARLFHTAGQDQENTPKQRGAREVRDSSVNRALAGLRRFFNFAVDRQFMEVSPFPKTPKSKLFYQRRKVCGHFFTDDQMLKIIEGAPDWLKAHDPRIVLHRVRAGELMGLRWNTSTLISGHSPAHVQNAQGHDRVGQRIVMQKELIDLLKGSSRNSEWVFAKTDGPSLIETGT